MKTRTQDSDGIVKEHPCAIGTVTAEMVSQRAREIALINRRQNDKPRPEDWQEARRELTDPGHHAHDPLEDLPASKRWDPVPCSAPHQAQKVFADDEQMNAETLVESGMEEADHEQMLEGTRQSVSRDRELGDSGT